MIRSGLRAGALLAFDLGRVVVEEVTEIAKRRLASLVFETPEISESGNPGFQIPLEEETDDVRALTPDEENELRRERLSMVARRSPAEDNPPLEPPLVGSREWRRLQQAR